MKVDLERLRELGVRHSVTAGTQQRDVALISSPPVDTNCGLVYLQDL